MFAGAKIDIKAALWIFPVLHALKGKGSSPHLWVMGIEHPVNMWELKNAPEPCSIKEVVYIRPN